MVYVGTLFTWFGFISSIALIFLSFFYKKDKKQLEKVINFVVFLPFLFALLSSIVLLNAFLTRNFQVDYVARYSSSDLPLFYTVTAFWAGQEGSLLLWTFLLSLFAVIFWFYGRKRSYIGPALGIVSITSAFFYLVVSVPANPFKLLPQPMREGFGLNPLLQNLGMIFHPPTVFFAYALFTFPFAIVLGVLLTRSLERKEWIRDLRLWALFAWLFIGIGNVLGALWAYVELGWGGFWAWDPVENASLLPWLTGTALLHSVTVYEKKKTLKVWTFILAFISFFMCILGTYITRSGTIASVHAFQTSPIAGYFLSALIAIILIPLFILAARYRDIQVTEIDNYLTRQGTYAISNWLFTAFTVVVLWGTLFPLFSSIFGGGSAGDEGLSVGRAFFDTYTAPIMFAIAVLISICPYFTYKGADLRKVLKILAVGYLVGIAVVALTWSFWKTNMVGALSGATGIAGLFTTGYLFMQDYRKFKGDFWKRFLANGRKYGGYIAHIGAILMFIGVFSATIYKEETNVTISPGESATFKDVRIIYQEPVYLKGPNYETYGAKVTLIDSGRKSGDFYPSFSFYPANNQQTYEVDIDWGIWRDVYLSLKDLKIQSPYTATITISLEPLTMFIWLGSLILFAGTVFALWPRKILVAEEEQEEKAA